MKEDKKIILVGLGNPGKDYEQSRHNIGFMILDHLLKKMTAVNDSLWKKSSKFNSEIAQVNDLIMVKPLSFMNESGKAVSAILNFYKIPPFGLYVIHDDLDLPLGKIKISIDRGSAGHKGVQSIISAVGSKNFVRIRVGIGKSAKTPAERFVLKPFLSAEKGKLKTTIKKAAEAVEMILKEGVEKASSFYNQ
ncbi:aminoacyl-tRNA hydrolase [Candidatus Microgenomates bacterium]|jgi:PTH1 family peptidyl-tRNA hydrolase|nr:MAG: aminoacyl-tRNA hydrolase [Candidatus Microgenomates bacterium]